MPSIPLTPSDEKTMLKAIGAQSIEDLFHTIPPHIRERASFDLEFGPNDPDRRDGYSEHELRHFFSELASKNEGATLTHFLGGGVYDNIIPAIVNQLSNRGEFLTSYTPYQPEVSQGTLQSIFEFQTMMARMTGMEVANASMYDGATAAAEAVMMAFRLNRNQNRRVLIAKSVESQTRTVTHTLIKDHAEHIGWVDWTTNGTLNLESLAAQVKETKPSAVMVGYPNYFGIIEPLDEIRALLGPEITLIVSAPDPSALSIFEAPGNMGANIVAGEAQQFGNPMNFGGPHVGFLTTEKRHVRQLPGRLVGETVDNRGQRCYSLTLATREQHIRRERATSNICTNQGLIALRTTIYLSFLGKQGFKQLGTMNYSLFDYLREEMKSVGLPLKFPKGQHYREGVFEIPNLEARFQKAVTNKIIPGIRLGRSQYNSDLATPAFSNSLLVSVHPKHTKSDLDNLVEVLSHE